MKTATDEEIVDAIAPYFPGVPKEDNLGPIKRMRASGAPIFSADPVLDKAVARPRCRRSWWKAASCRPTR